MSTEPTVKRPPYNSSPPRERDVVGIIDIGSNSVKCLIADLSQSTRSSGGSYADSVDDSLHLLYEDCKITGLASAMDRIGDIQKSGLVATQYALVDFHQQGISLGVSRWHIVGTAALRYVTALPSPAPNAARLAQFVSDQFSCNLDIISGEEEARYSYLGATSDAAQQQDSIVIDVGGASTEFIHANHANQINRVSIAIGIVQLCNRYLVSDPLTADAIEGLRQALRLKIDVVSRQFSEVFGTASDGTDHHCRVYGVSGTMTTIATLLAGATQYVPKDVHGYVLRYGAVDRLCRLVLPLTLSEREGLTGMLPKKRAEAMHVGLLFVSEMMSCLKIAEITVSHLGLRYGILSEIERTA